MIGRSISHYSEPPFSPFNLNNVAWAFSPRSAAAGPNEPPECCRDLRCRGAERTIRPRHGTGRRLDYRDRLTATPLSVEVALG
jgi:hypothetical protein